MENINENVEINKMSSEINSEIQAEDKTKNSRSEEKVETEEKLETKGLKLRKSTKNRLNELQGNFADAETMILALLNQYEMFKITDDNRFADRKAEIDKFTYLLDSIKSSYINSLEMASFIEEKYENTFKEELLRREKTLVKLQETIEKKEAKIKAKEEELKKKEEELKTVKDSFSRVNLALSTLEKENTDKAEVIKNLQSHITSLTEIAEEGKVHKEETVKLKEKINELKERYEDYEIIKDRLEITKNENSQYKLENNSLKEEVKTGREYSNSLNDKILNLLTDKSKEIDLIKKDYNNEIKQKEEDYQKIIDTKNLIIDELKEKIFNLRLELNK